MYFREAVKKKNKSRPIKSDTIQNQALSMICWTLSMICWTPAMTCWTPAMISWMGGVHDIMDPNDQIYIWMNNSASDKVRRKIFSQSGIELNSLILRILKIQFEATF